MPRDLDFNYNATIHIWPNLSISWINVKNVVKICFQFPFQCIKMMKHAKMFVFHNGIFLFNYGKTSVVLQGRCSSKYSRLCHHNPEKNEKGGVISTFTNLLTSPKLEADMKQDLQWWYCIIISKCLTNNCHCGTEFL